MAHRINSAIQAPARWPFGRSSAMKPRDDRDPGALELVHVHQRFDRLVQTDEPAEQEPRVLSIRSNLSLWRMKSTNRLPIT
jgi:hypothetical protein